MILEKLYKLHDLTVDLNFHLGCSTSISYNHILSFSTSYSFSISYMVDKTLLQSLEDIQPNEQTKPHRPQVAADLEIPVYGLNESVRTLFLAS